MQIGRKTQGQNFVGCLGSKAVACGLAHKSCPAKRRVRRAEERKVRQASRKACREI